jgi:lipopolysaccharide/colanic/teichoic acid biosynthesis glycosyltransferase
MDFVLASLGLLLTLPFMLAAALAVWVVMGRPIFFVQERAGRGGRPFRLLKLRTMTTLPAQPGNPPGDEHRLTPLGRWLRRRSLDELPQLWHVIKGDMSLVGPRPLPTTYLPRYSPTQARRHLVRPGLTGLAQINGRNATTWPERLAFDVWYVDHQSLLLDFRILVRTVRLVCVGVGVSAPGQATMREFTGHTAPFVNTDG